MYESSSDMRRQAGRSGWRYGRAGGLLVVALVGTRFVFGQPSGTATGEVPPGISPPIPTAPGVSGLQPGASVPGGPTFPVGPGGAAGANAPPNGLTPSAARVPAVPPLVDSPATNPKVIDGAPPAPGNPDVPAPANNGALPPLPSPLASGSPAARPTEPGPISGIRVLDPRRQANGLMPDRLPLPTNPQPEVDVSRRLTVGPPRDVNQMVSNLFSRVQDPEAEISLVVGQTKLLETREALTRIAVSNPAVADVDVLNDQPNTRAINLYGRSFGTTTITFWDHQNNPMTFLVRVSLDTLDLEARIKQTFPGAMVHVRQVGPQVILEGQVSDSKTMSDVLQLVTADLRNSGGSRAQGGSGAGASSSGGTAVNVNVGGAGAGAAGGAGGAGGLGGGLGGGGSGGAGGTNAQAYTIINRVVVPGPRQVMLRVKIAELNRTALRQIGVSWLDPKNNAILASTIGGAASIGATAGPFSQSVATAGRSVRPIASTFASSASATPANAQLYGIFNAGQFSIFLNALRSNAMAKILAEPNLMALDGQPARFLAGGLFPYPVPQSSSIPGGTAVVTVQFANFGAILSFLPHILANDEIQIDVEPVFSQLNFGAGTTINGGRVPAIDQRSARTVVRLREGQTLAIAGLLQTTTNNTTQRIPILGDLPIVGPLFSANSAETVETELVVLVTPELVAPMEANEVPPAPGDRVNQPNDYEFFFLGRIEGKLGHDFRDTTRELDPLSVMKHFQSENRWVVGPHGYAD